MSETDLSGDIAKAIGKIGGYVIRIQSGVLPMPGRRVHCAHIGTPDRLVLLPYGRCVWLEIKTQERSSKLSTEQMQWRDRARRLGHLVYEVRSVREAIEACQEAMR